MDRAARYEQDALDWLKENPVHRGQWCGGDGLRTALPTYAFGTERAAKIYAESPNDRTLSGTSDLIPKIFKARLSVDRVYCRTGLDDTDPYFDLDVIGSEFGRDVMLALVSDCMDAIQDTGGFIDLYEETGLSLIGMAKAWPETLRHLPPVPGYLALQVPEFVQALKDAGYDAVALGGSGETALEMEWHIFDAGCAICVETGEPIGFPDDEELLPCP